MTGQAVSDVHSNKENEARTMNTKPSVKIGEEKVRVDPQLLFQRLLHVAGGDLTKLAEIFRYELTAVPASLFDDSGFMRESSKYLLAKHLWNSEFEADLTKEERLHHVLDRGSLLHHLPWSKGHHTNIWLTATSSLC